MTKKQIEQFNKMRDSLLIMSKNFKSADWILKNSEKEYGLSGKEALEMAYDNIQRQARVSVKGIREIKY